LIVVKHYNIPVYKQLLIVLLKKEKYNSVGTVPKFNRKILKTDPKIDTGTFKCAA